MGRENQTMLAVLIAASIHFACGAEERYPDPVDPKKYYIRNPNSSFSHQTCPGNLSFESPPCLCVLRSNCTSQLPVLRWLTGSQCGCLTGFYCNSITHFTYCTYDGIKILNNVACPSGNCSIANTKPCMWRNYKTTQSVASCSHSVKFMHVWTVLLIEYN